MTTTLNDLGSFFSWRCQQQPDALAYAFVRDTLEVEESVSYAQLQSQVQALAQRVRAESQFGDRVLLVYPSGLEFVRAFWACMLTGRIAVPVPAPDPVRFKNNAPRLRAIIRDAQAALVLTNQQLLEPAQAFRDDDGQGTGATWIATDVAPEAQAVPPDPAPLAPIGPASIAYLQYTSGSTSSPRGVILTHANVIAQARTGGAAVGVEAQSSRLLCWLPHFHDYGLVFGTVLPFCAGVPSYLMSPLTFLRRPLRWLDAVGRFRISHTGAPNFAYVACVKALAQQTGWQADLSSLLSSSCGAEPIHPDTPLHFQTAFAPHGLRADVFAPAYGMAETVLGVTATPPRAAVPVLSLAGEALARGEVSLAAADARQLRRVVGCGIPFPEMRLLIVDPHTLQPGAAGHVGEIWVQGSSVGQGYWRREQMSTEVFGAHTAGGDGPYLRTGDLGFLRDGSLFVTGRFKDLVIVHGRNHAPQDIEWSVQHSSPALRAGYGAAFSIPGDDGEALVVVQEVERGVDPAEFDALVRGIRRAVADAHDLPVHAVVLTAPGTVPRTTSGKIRRQSCRQAYLDATLQVLRSDVLADVPAPDAAAADFGPELRALADPAQRQASIERGLVNLVARFARRRPQDIRLDASAVESGLDSLSTFRLLQSLESQLGLTLPAARLLGESSLAGVAALIAELLASPAPAGLAIPRLSDKERDGALPLSAAQQRMGFWQALAPDTALYTVTTALALRGALDEARLQQGLTDLMQRHPILRSRWVNIGGQPMQRIDAAHGWQMEHVDLSASGAGAAAQEFDRLAAQEASRPLDPERELPMRATLVRLGRDEHRLLWTLHHSVCDGWSIELLLEELGRLITAAPGATSPVQRPLDYLDYASWEPTWLASGLRERELAYWKRTLSGAPPALALPTDHPAPAQQRHRGASLAVSLAPNQVSALRRLAQETGSTLFMALLASWQVLMQRYSGESSVVTGSVIANRDRSDLAPVVGYFANTLALRTDFHESMTIANLLAQVRERALGAIDHQHVPFEEVIEALRLPRQGDRTPLVQTMVVLQAAAEALPDWGLLRVERLPLASTLAKFELTLELQEHGEALRGAIEYDADRFEPATIARLAGHWLTLVESMCGDATRPVSRLTLIDPAELARLLALGNAAPSFEPVQRLFEQQVQRTPHAVAAIGGEQRLSYEQLNQRANRLAHALRSLGVAGEVRVAICMERSLEYLVALWGTLKAGGALVPIDAELPPDRIAFQLLDTAAPIVLTQDKLLRRLPDVGTGALRHVLCLDPQAPVLTQGRDDNPAWHSAANDLAYVIYTSGSTGRPKGVMLEHAGLRNHRDWLCNQVSLAASDRVLALTSIGFDASLVELVHPLTCGAGVVLGAPGLARDTEALAALLQTRDITLLQMVPSGLRALLGEPGFAAGRLRTLICGGEALDEALARGLSERLAGCVIGNFYGPTECSIDALHCEWPVRGTASGVVPIGRPISGMQCLVLDAHGMPVPPGVAGELHIGGIGLARGYLNRPELTAERFIVHPFAPGQRLYRSGDLARVGNDGRFEFLGRIDSQVKIRGHRIELGEIEAALHAQAGVQQAAVVVDAAQPTRPRLVAFIVAASSDAQLLQRALAQQLPEYMVPAAFVFLPQMPVLANGKADRKTLEQRAAEQTAQRAFEAPQGPTETLLADVWRELLAVERVGRADNFFELGGHSLLAMRLISRLRTRSRIELPLRTLFDTPTLAELSAQIDSRHSELLATGAIPHAPAIPGATLSAPLTTAQQGLWIADRLDAGGAAYNVAHALRLHGQLDLAALRASLDALVARHDSLRSAFGESGGLPTQTFMEPAAWPLTVVDLEGLATAERDAALQDGLRQSAESRFDLAAPPLARARLFRLGEQEHVLALAVHHIACDGWSLDVLLRELALTYDAEHRGAAATVPPPPLSWRDLAHWEARRREAGELDAALPYWRERLQGLEPTRLPRDADAASGRAESAPFERVRLAETLAVRLEALAREHNATVFMLVLTAVKTLLARRTGRDDVAIGTPVAGRDRPELESVVGLLLNTLVLRTDLAGKPSFLEALGRVRAGTLDAFANQSLPFERLVAELAPPRAPDEQPFFDVMVNAFGAWSDPPAFGNLQSESIELATVAPKFPLTIYLQAGAGQLELGLVARRDHFSAAGLRSLRDQLLHLLEQVADRPDRALADYSLVAPPARALLADPSQALPLPRFESVLHAFIDQAQRAPAHTAVRSGQRSHDYAALLGKTHSLALLLQRAGVQAHDVVAISGPRCFGVVAAMLAALRCGAVFMPLDSALPVQRRRTMLAEAGARFLCAIGAEATLDDTESPAAPLRTVMLDPELDELPDVGVTSAESWPGGVCAGDDPAYVFFTSGSSGKPKAVLGRHRGLSHFVAWQRTHFAVTPADRVSQLVGLSFDPMLRDVFLPLTSGATLCIPQERDLLDPLAWMARERISIAHTTPTVLQSWLQTYRAGAALPRLRCLFIAGEPLTDTLVQSWRSRAGHEGNLINLYGPTETTLARCFHVIGARPSRGVQPVGAALPDSQALVLTAQGAPCGIGEVGEIVIRTPLRSLGYLGQPEETERRFRPNPWRDDASDKLYFTGDLGRVRPDGALEILGRMDDQVKIRGVRIEPAEVMAVLARHPAVRQCAVLPRPGPDGSTRLVAYVVSAETVEADALRTHLAAQLPPAYVPAAFVWLDELPTLPNGKVDRARLPAAPAEVAASTQWMAPRSPVEQALWDIWREVLHVEGFGVNDSFFALGGHSLLATQVLARVRDSLGVELPLRALFEAPSLAGQAAAIEQLLQRGADTSAALPPIRRLARDGLLPSSYSQRRMWLIQQFNPETAAYNMPFAIRLRGALDRAAFGAALQRLIERHEAFRTTLVAQNGEPMQRIAAALPAALEFIDLRELPASVRRDAAADLLRQRSLVPYRLAQGPLHRMLMLQLDADDHVFFWSIHHAIGDGWSSGVLMRELVQIYPALRRGEEPALEPKPFDFADYAAWQREVLRGPVLERQLQFWRETVAGLEPLPLPTDRPRRHAHDGRGQRVSAVIAPATLAGIKALAVEQGVTPFMALLACFQLLLARCCGVTDIAVGTPIANRTQRASEQLVGTLVNTIVMRTELAGNPSFTELLQRVRDTALAAYAHQDLPFEALVEALALPRSEGVAPLVQVLFNVLNPPGSALRMDGVDFELFEFENGTSQFDLGLSIDTELFGEARLSFATALFDTATGERLLSSYLGLLDQVVAAPDALLSNYRLVDEDSQKTLSAWNTSPVQLSAPPAAHLHGLIDAQAARTPHRVALRSSTGSLKYAELAARSNQLARLLRARGIGRGQLVGLCVERSLDMVVAQLAVLKCGAAYVPLDPAYPEERIAHMCNDAQLALLITESEVHTPHWLAHKSLLLDLDRGAISAQDGAPLAPDAALDAGGSDPAYVIYTSGSTGKPKGVVVPHGAAVNFLRSMAQQPGLSADDALVAVTTLSFDIAVLELLLPLTLGAQVVLASRQEAASGKLLRRLLERRAATVMQATPSTWRMLIDAGWQGSPTFKALIGGEALPQDLADQLRNRTGELWNMYGPTETTVWSTCWRVEPGAAISIGAPIANTQVHVLDPHGQACPIGVAGEIFIGGDGVALGYLNRPELTAERFVHDPFRSAPGARMYRTGDRGRWRNDGLLEHLGRLDHQVKVRGHRIELGEIEATLAQHAAVAHAVVIVREDRPGDVRLVAYLIAKAHTATPARDALRDHLRLTLPDYMLPQHMVWLDSLPLLPNGKLDRHALPVPSEPSVERAVAAETLSPVERAIAEVWQELLGVAQVGLRDNFFDLGGHSLLAVRAVAAIEARTGLQIDARRLVFESLAQLGTKAEEPAETQY